jgi:hypothetical protein
LFDAVEAEVKVEIFGEGISEIHTRNVGHGLFNDLEVVDGLAWLRRT